MLTPAYSPELKRTTIEASGAPEVGTQDVMEDKEFAATYDDVYRQNNPLSAAYDSKNRFRQGQANQLAKPYREYVAPVFDTVTGGAQAALNSGYVPAIGLGAAAGLGAGVLLKLLRNIKNQDSGGYDTSAGLGALAGGALAAASHAYRAGNMQKVSFAMIQDPLTAVMLDTSLSGNEKQEVLRALGRLSISEKNELSRLLSTVAGAGVGAFILRYLIGKGLIPTAIGAILGGVIGRGMISTHQRNSLNQFY